MRVTYSIAHIVHLEDIIVPTVKIWGSFVMVSVKVCVRMASPFDFV